ncbi:hypothetical protein GCK72_022746 [Caenorhabditis remanei]|uniref:Uncharacterized protein n=1 Tax=Caenorhabditis remanei TaxID=31234 RepID=A0A6A5FUT3_CAERE|nr:hypothetical protein GCK72_022746 [Caenorhabditis remanei]KAF1746293.1 hypothetical protein GCK72_022746 [Caenorhabditis remanei]
MLEFALFYEPFEPVFGHGCGTRQYLHFDEKEGCRYQVGKNSRIMPMLNFHWVFMLDFQNIARHPKLEELDFYIVEDRFPMYLEWTPYKFFKNCAISFQELIPCKKFSITVVEWYDDYKDQQPNCWKYVSQEPRL